MVILLEQDLCLIFSGDCSHRHVCQMWKNRTCTPIFDEMSKRDVVSWNSMIAGYGMHGYGEHA
jgi:hypothetical protein